MDIPGGVERPAGVSPARVSTAGAVALTVTLGLAGVAWGAVVFGERLSIYALAAMALMFVGVFLSGYRRSASVSLSSTLDA